MMWIQKGGEITVSHILGHRFVLILFPFFSSDDFGRPLEPRAASSISFLLADKYIVAVSPGAFSLVDARNVE
jgi:hypothetical protein